MAVVNISASSDGNLPLNGAIEDLHEVTSGAFSLDFKHLKHINESFEIKKLRLYCKRTSGVEKTVLFMNANTTKGTCFHFLQSYSL